MRLATAVFATLLAATALLVTGVQAQPQLVPPSRVKLLDRPIFHPFVNHWPPHVARSCNQHGVSAYNYGHDVPRRSKTIASLQGTPPENVVLQTQPAVPAPQAVAQPPGAVSAPQPLSQIIGTQFLVPPPVLDTQSTRPPSPVQRRLYLAPALELDLLRVDQMGFNLFSNGNLLFSARLFDQGGAQGQLKGHWVTLTLRARLGFSNEIVQQLQGREGGPADGPVAWKLVHIQWLSARQPQTITLTATADPALRELFERITGFDITLEYEAPELADAFGEMRR